MTLAWLLNFLGLLLTTIGALLLFLYLLTARKWANHWLTPDARVAYAKHNRLITVAVGLITLWLLLEYLAILIK
jgi:hypothetical protein